MPLSGEPAVDSNGAVEQSEVAPEAVAKNNQEKAGAAQPVKS